MALHGPGRIGCCCGSHCECEPKTLGAFTTNVNNPVWDLTPYSHADVDCSGARWRLREVGASGGGGSVYGNGVVDDDGFLVGLPSSFRTGYYYDGYMRLEIGCPQEESGVIQWPVATGGDLHF